MSAPAFVVVPVGNEDDHGQKSVDHEQIAAAVKSSLKDSKAKDAANGEPVPTGSLRTIMDNSDSLYKYINWEDPARTLGAYAAAMAVLFGAHYIPLTQFALKYTATALGAVCLVEFAGRSFTSKTLSARLRPEGGYAKLPEPTLNATLRDVHDLLQAVVVEAQKIIFGEDLRKTFAAFATASGTYWLIQLITPFWLTVLGVTSVFLAPLATSPHGRATTRRATQRGAEAAGAAAENGKQLVREGATKAGELAGGARASAAQAATTTTTTRQASAAHASGTAADAAGGAASGRRGHADDSVAGDATLGNEGASATGGPREGGRVFGDGDDARSRYVAADAEEGTRGIMNRARGNVALGETAAAAGF